MTRNQDFTVDDGCPSLGLTRRDAIGLLVAGAGFGLVTALPGGARLVAAGQRPAATVTFPRGAIIRTILKDVSPEALGGGATLFHEHLSIMDPHPARRLPDVCG